MERKMYKADREISQDEVFKVLARGNHGTLSVNGDDGYPYAVPVNYVVEDGKIYIHSAKYGYKIDAIKENNKVCFSAIVSSLVVQNMFTAAFESVIATGKISIVTDESHRRHILEQYIYKLAPDCIENGMKFVNAAIAKTELLCIDVEKITGKQNMAEKFDCTPNAYTTF